VPERRNTRSRLLHAAASPLGSLTPAELHISKRKNCSDNRVQLSPRIRLTHRSSFVSAQAEVRLLLRRPSSLSLPTLVGSIALHQAAAARCTETGTQFFSVATAVGSDTHTIPGTARSDFGLDNEWLTCHQKALIRVLQFFERREGRSLGRTCRQVGRPKWGWLGRSCLRVPSLYRCPISRPFENQL
jgi:hypothetical protein